MKPTNIVATAEPAVQVTRARADANGWKRSVPAG